MIDNYICCGSVHNNLNFFWIEKQFFSGMGICCMFPLTFWTTFALMLTVLLSFDFSVKVTNDYVTSRGPNVKIVSLSDSVGSNFNL